MDEEVDARDKAWESRRAGRFTYELTPFLLGLLNEYLHRRYLRESAACIYCGVQRIDALHTFICERESVCKEVVGVFSPEAVV